MIPIIRGYKSPLVAAYLNDGQRTISRREVSPFLGFTCEEMGQDPAQDASGERNRWPYPFGADDRDLRSLLPGVDPAFVSLPPATLQAVMDHAAQIESTLPLLFYFDAGFKVEGHAPAKTDRPGDRGPAGKDEPESD